MEEEKYNQIDKTVEKEIRSKHSKQLQNMLFDATIGLNAKEAIKAELNIRLSRGIDDLDMTMSGVESSVDMLEKSIHKLNESTTKYNRWLTGFTVAIAFLTLVMVIKMFFR